MAWEKIFAQHISYKGLIFKTYNKIKQFTAKTSKQANNPIFKWPKNPNRFFFKEDTKMGNKNMIVCQHH